MVLLYIVMGGSIPEFGQRGVTQDHMLYASRVQIPLLPKSDSEGHLPV